MTFKAGQSGNSKGRPKGIIDQRVALRELLQPHAKDLIEKLVELAKKGDVGALKLCVDRLIPCVKQDKSIYIDMPEGMLDTGDNMLQITIGITDAVATGQLSIEEAERFTNFLELQRRHLRNARSKIKDDLTTEEQNRRWAALAQASE